MCFVVRWLCQRSVMWLWVLWAAVGEGRLYLKRPMCEPRRWGRGYRVIFEPLSFPTLSYLNTCCLFLVKATLPLCTRVFVCVPTVAKFNFTADSHLWNQVLQDTYSVQPSSGSLKSIISTSPLHHWNLSNTHFSSCSACVNDFSFHLIHHIVMVLNDF